MYLHHTSELLSKIHHMMGMSQILTEGLDHYTMVYRLNLNRLKDNIVGPLGTYWGTCKIASVTFMLLVLDMRVKGYSWADFHAQEEPVYEVKSTKEPWHCFKCSRPHFQNRCMKIKSYYNDKFWNYKKIDNPQKFWQNYHYNGQFPTETISFQESKQVNK